MDTIEIEDVPGPDNISTLSPADVYQVALLLTRLNIPKDVIPRILDFGGFYVGQLASQNNERCTVSQSVTRFVHSSATIPANIHRKSVRAVIFETVSHDQGWSSYPNQQGTYLASWTWFEAGIDQKDDKDGTAIITNIHASNRWRRHRVRWSRDDQNAYIQNVFDRLEAGDEVAISARARYPGWVNHIASTSITIEYLPVRKVP